MFHSELQKPSIADRNFQLEFNTMPVATVLAFGDFKVFDRDLVQLGYHCHEVLDTCDGGQHTQICKFREARYDTFRFLNGKIIKRGLVDLKGYGL